MIASHNLPPQKEKTHQIIKQVNLSLLHRHLSKGNWLMYKTVFNMFTGKWQYTVHNCSYPSQNIILHPSKVKQPESKPAVRIYHLQVVPLRKQGNSESLTQEMEMQTSAFHSKFSGRSNHSCSVWLILANSMLWNLMVKESHRVGVATSDPKPPNRLWFF